MAKPSKPMPSHKPIPSHIHIRYALVTDTLSTSRSARILEEFDSEEEAEAAIPNYLEPDLMGDRDIRIQKIWTNRKAKK